MRSNPPSSVGKSPAELLLNMTLAALQGGQAQQALKLATQLTDIAPRMPQAHLVLARALRACRQHTQAVQACRAALKLAPDHVGALLELALAQRHAGLVDDAEQSLQQALLVAPTQAVLHHNLANLLQRRKAWAEAESHYRRAIELAPQLAEAHTELGCLLQAQGQEEAARQCFAEALAVRPDFSPAWQRLSASLNLADPVKGIHDLQRGARDGQTSPRILVMMAEAALRLDPQNVLGHYTHGLALRLQGDLEAALPPLEKVLALAPDHAIGRQSLYLHTLCLMERGEVFRAIPGAMTLLERSDSDEERSKAHQLLAGLQFDSGDIHTALQTYRQAVDLAPGLLPPRISYCAAHLYAPGMDATAQFKPAQDLIGPLVQRVSRPPHENEPDPDRRLRVAYLSGDLRQHSCAYFLSPLLQQHDPQQVELYAYATERYEDEVTQRMKQHVPHWRQVTHLSDEELAAQIRADGIDILIDLAGLTDGGRLPTLARQPAPVQMLWLGYLGSTGLSTVHYRLTDEWVDQAQTPFHIGETPLPLGRTYVCYAPPDDAPEVSLPPMLSRGYPTFGSFNALTKLSDPCLALWCAVLHARPDARLLIKTKALRDSDAREALMARLTRHGIGAERITLQGWTPDTQSHLDIYKEVDVALDSSPFNGVTTTCEASWMGVPVVSLVGHTPVSRQGLTLLHALGTPEQATDSEADFVARCQALVQDPQVLAAQRATLRSRMASSPLMDAPGFARSVEAALRQAWQRWCTDIKAA